MANTEVGIFEFGDKSLVFEVRGLETDPLRGAKVGVIFYGSEGYVVLNSYTGGAAFDPQGQAGDEVQGRAATISAISSTRSRPATTSSCTPTFSKATSPAPTATWPTSPTTSASRPRSTQIRQTLAALKTNEDVADCLDRTLEHLAANGVDLAKTPMSLGPMLKIDASQRNGPRQPGRLRDVDPRVSQPVRGSQAGRSVRSHSPAGRWFAPAWPPGLTELHSLAIVKQ